MFGLFRDKTPALSRVAALDALRTNVMIADLDLTIRYMNPSVIALMKEAEADLKKELPRFSVDTLIGSNIDVFHKNPGYQRGMLAKMVKPHNATIRVGARVFDLLVTPIKGQDKLIGFVVEWSDAKERILNLDYASMVTAVGKYQAVVEFSTDGIVLSANDLFLKLMGYRRDEVVGRHHRIFVDQATHQHPDYLRFWQNLGRGEFQKARFKRLTKSGEAVWIEGAYNPILDEKGHVKRIVKFAIDVTKQTKMLADLKVLIDHNIGEIGSAITLSTAEARSASEAARQTTGNVNQVADSAEQLARSIGEISVTMAKSREATEHAATQIEAVGRNTEQLAQATQAMGGIVGLIRSIANQINMLALNATIESARAGDAGKGFAVVASEVKNLAVQASKATEQIASEILGIQATSQELVGALDLISTAVATLRDSATMTAAAVEEQTAVTRSMSDSMQSASGAVSTVSANIHEIAEAIVQAGVSVDKTKEAARVLAA